MSTYNKDVVTALGYLINLTRSARFTQTAEEASVMLRNLESIAQLAQALAEEPAVEESADVVED